MIARGYIKSVELLKEGQSTWTSLKDLPRPLGLPSASICGEKLYVISDKDTAYSISLSHLFTQEQPTSASIEWEKLTSLPVNNSTVATLSEQLIIVGGSKAHQEATSTIYQLLNNEWIEIAFMKSGRFMCIVGTPSPREVVVIGGYKKRGMTRSKCVEVCTSS